MKECLLSQDRLGLTSSFPLTRYLTLTLSTFLTSLSLNFLICKMGIMICPTLTLKIKNLIPERWSVLLNVPQQVGVKDIWVRLIMRTQETGLLVRQTSGSLLYVFIPTLGTQVWPHLTFQKLYISCEIMRCGMEAGRIYMAVKCSLVSKIWLHYSLWHSKDHLCPLAFGWISRYSPWLRKHCRIFLCSLIFLFSITYNALAFGKSNKINMAFYKLVLSFPLFREQSRNSHWLSGGLSSLTCCLW